MSDDDSTPEVWEAYVRDGDGDEWDALTFSNPEAAEEHIRLTLESMADVPKDSPDFERTSDRVRRARVGSFTGYVVRPKVWDSAPEKEEEGTDG